VLQGEHAKNANMHDRAVQQISHMNIFFRIKRIIREIILTKQVFFSKK